MPGDPGAGAVSPVYAPLEEPAVAGRPVVVGDSPAAGGGVASSHALGQRGHPAQLGQLEAAGHGLGDVADTIDLVLAPT